MTRDDILRLVYAFGPIVFLAIGVQVYHLRYLRQRERDRVSDGVDDGAAGRSHPPTTSSSTR